MATLKFISVTSLIAQRRDGKLNRVSKFACVTPSRCLRDPHSVQREHKPTLIIIGAVLLLLLYAYQHLWR